MSSFQEILSIQSLHAIVRGEANRVPQLSREYCTFDYETIPAEFRAGTSSGQLLTLYKGGFVKREDFGFSSQALRYGISSHVHEVRKWIESGDTSLVSDLIDQHTNYYLTTALLSATLSPQMAQVFAPTRNLQLYPERTTIYQLRIRADRCILDARDIGKCGASKEFLILGRIFPDEITAVKIDNSDERSELLDFEGGVRVIRRRPPEDTCNTAPRDPTNWNYLR